MNLSKDEWYKELTRVASVNGVSALPAWDGVAVLYESDMSPEQAYAYLYPPQPVTVDAEPVDTLEESQTTTLVTTGEKSKELELAEAIPSPRVTEADVLAKIVNKQFMLTPSGRTIICEITLRNGFTARGESSQVFVNGINDKVGQANALTAAVRKAWEYEAYLLRETLYLQELAKIAKASIGIGVDSDS